MPAAVAAQAPAPAPVGDSKRCSMAISLSPSPLIVPLAFSVPGSLRVTRGPHIVGRFGTQQDRNDFRVLAWHFTGELTAVFLYIMSMLPYFERSAKEGFNVEAAFECIARNAIKNEPKEEIYLPDTIEVGGAGRQQHLSSCEC